MIGVGFVNVQEELYEVCKTVHEASRNTTLITKKLPQGPWSKDPKFQELGRYNEYSIIEAFPTYAYALFTRVLGWQRLEIEALLAGARRELKDPSVHLYTRVHVIYGQKPRLLEQFLSLVRQKAYINAIFSLIDNDSLTLRAYRKLRTEWRLHQPSFDPACTRPPKLDILSCGTTCKLKSRSCDEVDKPHFENRVETST